MITILLACIFYGIETKFYFNLKEQKSIFQILIFGNIAVLRIDFLLFNQKIYYSLNHKPYKLLKLTVKTNKNRIQITSPIKIDNFSYYVFYGNGQNQIKTLFNTTIFAFLSEFLPLFLKKYINFENVEKIVMPKFYDSNCIVLLNAKISKGIFDILKNLLHAKTKGENYANWKFNWQHYFKFKISDW